MCYRITWGAIVTGGPTWTPTPAPCATGFLFAGGDVGLQLFPSLLPPGWFHDEQAVKGSLNETIPFAVSGPSATVNATLQGSVVGAFALSRTPGNFFLLPTFFSARGKVEIRDGAGAPLYSVSEWSLSKSAILFTSSTQAVNLTATQPCVLNVGPAYQLYVELEVAVDLHVWRFWNVTATQGPSAVADFIAPPGATPGTAGTSGKIILPPCPTATTLTPGGAGGATTFTPPVVFPPEPP